MSASLFTQPSPPRPPGRCTALHSRCTVPTLLRPPLSRLPHYRTMITRTDASSEGDRRRSQ